MSLPWDRTPPSPLARVRVLRVRPGSSVRLMLLDEPVAARLHWIDGSMPCLGDACPYCPMKAYRRWYAPAVLVNARDNKLGSWKWVVELSEDNMLAVGEQPLWHGLVIELERTSNHPAQLALPKILGDIKKPDPSTVWRVQPVLERLWGIRMEEGAQQPRPKLRRFGG